MEIITSKANEKIKKAVQLRDSAHRRKSEGLFFCEGARLCRDCAENEAEILYFFFTRQAREKFGEYFSPVFSRAAESFEISPEVADKLSATKQSQGMFCVCSRRNAYKYEDLLSCGGKFLLLENVQDPSNLGAVCRSAEAFGISGLFICGGCDLYNPKAVRASMGAALRMKTHESESAKELLEYALGKNYELYAAVVHEEAQRIDKIRFAENSITVIGNEGSGITPETVCACPNKITVPMAGRAESLNASAAAAVIMWEMVRDGS